MRFLKNANFKILILTLCVFYALALGIFLVSKGLRHYFLYVANIDRIVDVFVFTFMGGVLICILWQLFQRYKTFKNIEPRKGMKLPLRIFTVLYLLAVIDNVLSLVLER